MGTNIRGGIINALPVYTAITSAVESAQITWMPILIWYLLLYGCLHLRVRILCSKEPIIPLSQSVSIIKHQLCSVDLVRVGSLRHFYKYVATSHSSSLLCSNYVQHNILTYIVECRSEWNSLTPTYMYIR